MKPSQSYDWQTDEWREHLPSKAVVCRELTRFLANLHHLIFVALSIYALGPFCTVAIGIGLMVFALSRSPS
jgi:hypothetical protein